MASDSESIVKNGKHVLMQTKHAILPRHNSSLFAAYFTAILLIVLCSLIVAAPSIAYSIYVWAYIAICIGALYIIFQTCKRWMNMDSNSTECQGATHLVILATMLFGTSLTLTVTGGLVHYLIVINYICLVFSALGLGFGLFWLFSEEKHCNLKQEAQDLMPMPMKHNKKTKA